jgi:PKD repeat protein
MTTFSGNPRESSVGFSLCGKGYFGTGGQGLSAFYKDFWEYTPPDYAGGVCFTEPVANFRISNDAICENACVNFIDTSSNDPAAWLWSFPGGTPSSSTLQNPGNICYGNAGSYSVSLIVSKGSCADTLAQLLAVADSCTPDIFANGNITGDSICPGNCIDFSAQFPVAPDSYLWQFPGGSPATSTLQDPNVCYANGGAFDVILIYTTNGLTDTITKSDFITVGSASLSLTFTLSVTTANLQTGAVKVTVTGGIPPYQYSLDNINFQSSNIFTSLPLGTYQVYVTDGAGCTGQGTFIIDEANCCGND